MMHQLQGRAPSLHCVRYLKIMYYILTLYYILTAPVSSGAGNSQQSRLEQSEDGRKVEPPHSIGVRCREISGRDSVVSSKQSVQWCLVMAVGAFHYEKT